MSNKLRTSIVLFCLTIALLIVSVLGCGSGDGIVSSDSPSDSPTSSPSSTITPWPTVSPSISPLPPNETKSKLVINVSNISRFMTKGDETLEVGVVKTNSNDEILDYPLESSSVPQGDSYSNEFDVEGNSTYHVTAVIKDDSVTAVAESKVSVPPGSQASISISLSSSNTSIDFNGDFTSSTSNKDYSDLSHLKAIGVWYWMWDYDRVEETYDYGGDKDWKVFFKDSIHYPHSYNIGFQLYAKSWAAYYLAKYYQRKGGISFGGWMDDSHLNIFIVLGGGGVQWVFFNNPNWAASHYCIKYKYY